MLRFFVVILLLMYKIHMTIILLKSHFSLFIMNLFLSAFISMPYLEEVSLDWCVLLCQSDHLSSAKQNLLMLWPVMLTAPWCPSKASLRMNSRKILKSVGDRRQHCHALTDAWNPFTMEPWNSNVLHASSYSCWILWINLSMWYLFILCPQCFVPHSVKGLWGIEKVLLVYVLWFISMLKSSLFFSNKFCLEH